MRQLQKAQPDARLTARQDKNLSVAEKSDGKAISVIAKREKSAKVSLLWAADSQRPAADWLKPAAVHGRTNVWSGTETSTSASG